MTVEVADKRGNMGAHPIALAIERRLARAAQLAGVLVQAPADLRLGRGPVLGQVRPLYRQAGPCLSGGRQYGGAGALETVSYQNRFALRALDSRLRLLLRESAPGGAAKAFEQVVAAPLPGGGPLLDLLDDAGRGRRRRGRWAVVADGARRHDRQLGVAFGVGDVPVVDGQAAGRDHHDDEEEDNQMTDQ